MVVQPCRIARCATGSFRSIQPFFFFPRSLFLFFTRTRTLEYARNTLPPLIRETSILLLGPRRYCRIAAMLPIRSSHYSPTRIGIGKDEPIHPFFPASMRFERDVGCCGCGLSNEIRNFGNFFFAIRWSFLYYNFLDLFEMVSTRWFVEMLEMIAFQCGVWMCSRWDRLIRGYESFFRCVFIRNTSSYIRWR